MKAKISESDFMSWVIDYAHLKKWLVAHFRPAMIRSGKWVTPVQADGAGFPDLVMVREKRLLVVEVKSDIGYLSAAQEKWLKAFGGVKGIEAYVWRPKDKKEVMEILK